MNVMRSEILQQPGVCAALLEREQPRLLDFVKRLRRRPPVGIVLAARGSSDHAAMYARYLLEDLTGVPAHLAAPSLLTVYRARPRFGDYLVVGVSQSGQGPDVNAVVREAARQGAATLALTNDPRSPLARAARHVIDLGADREQAIAATKTFTAELMGLALLGALWKGEARGLRRLWAVPALMAEALRQTEDGAGAVARALKGLQACVVVGRGYQMGVAHEMGLKMKECAGVPALSYSTADFAHGPVSLAKAGFPVFVVSAPGRMQADAQAACADFLRRGARVYRVGLRDPGFSRRHPRLDTRMAAGVRVEEAWSPLLSILPGQWFAYYNALAKGLDPAMPKGLKKVTKTR